LFEVFSLLGAAEVMTEELETDLSFLTTSAPFSLLLVTLDLPLDNGESFLVVVVDLHGSLGDTVSVGFVAGDGREVEDDGDDDDRLLRYVFNFEFTFETNFSLDDDDDEDC
jgi:hypothetical protein